MKGLQEIVNYFNEKLIGEEARAKSTIDTFVERAVNCEDANFDPVLYVSPDHPNLSSIVEYAKEKDVTLSPSEFGGTYSLKYNGGISLSVINEAVDKFVDKWSQEVVVGDIMVYPTGNSIFRSEVRRILLGMIEKHSATLAGQITVVFFPGGVYLGSTKSH